MKGLPLAIFLLATVPSHLPGADTPAFPEGEILLRQTAGEQVIDWRFTKSADTLRIEQITESRPPPPVNLINLESGDVTIIAPINRSVRTLPASAFHPEIPDASPHRHGGELAIPPGIGANPSPPGTSQSGHAPAGNLPGPAGIPPDQPGQLIPEMPAIPGLPGGFSSLPPAPASAPPTGELVAHEEKRVFHGYQARLHTLRIDSGLELTLWLAKQPDLPPFAFPVSSPPPQFASADPTEDWPAIVRKGGHFPMFAELRDVSAIDAGEAPAFQPEILTTWEVLSIHAATPDASKFEIPEDYTPRHP